MDRGVLGVRVVLKPTVVLGMKGTLIGSEVE
jgi:hypothetical protein